MKIWWYIKEYIYVIDKNLVKNTSNNKKLKNIYINTYIKRPYFLNYILKVHFVLKKW